jgi:hypothetical protein
MKKVYIVSVKHRVEKRVGPHLDRVSVIVTEIFKIDDLEQLNSLEEMSDVRVLDTYEYEE